MAIFVGCPVGDENLSLADTGATAGKVTCAIDLELGGGVVNAARAYAQLATAPLVAAIVGDDPLSELMLAMLEEEFEQFLPIRAADHGRVSVVLPSRIYTTRPRVNGEKVVGALRPHLRRGRLLAVAPMSDADHDWLLPLLGAARQAGMVTHMQLSDDQATRPARAMELARTASRVQLQAGEIAALSGVPDRGDLESLIEGTMKLRDQGLRVVATGGERGAVAFWNHCWSYAHALDVPGRKEKGADDVFFGTMAAGAVRGKEPHESLRVASAAAALHVAGRPPSRSWSALRRFAQTHPRHMPQPRHQPSSGGRWGRRAAYAGVAAALAWAAIDVLNLGIL